MSPQAGWLLVNQIVPRLKVLIPQTVPHIGHEDTEELVQDSTVMAAHMLNNAERKGKRYTAGTIAHYTVLHARSGRRSYASGSGCCMHPKNRMFHSEPQSFDHVISDEAGEPLTLSDILSVNQIDPSVEAARKLDWLAFLEQETDKAKAIILCLVEGSSMQALAVKLKIDVSTLRSEKQQLGQRLLEFMGADVVVECSRPPKWRANLDADRERMACREERKSW